MINLKKATDAAQVAKSAQGRAKLFTPEDFDKPSRIDLRKRHENAGRIDLVKPRRNVQRIDLVKA